MSSSLQQISGAFLCALACAIFTTTYAAASTPSLVVIAHKPNSKDLTTQPLELSNGDQFQITVTGTCKNYFNISVINATKIEADKDILKKKTEAPEKIKQAEKTMQEADQKISSAASLSSSLKIKLLANQLALQQGTTSRFFEDSANLQFFNPETQSQLKSAIPAKQKHQILTEILQSTKDAIDDAEKTLSAANQEKENAGKDLQKAKHEARPACPGNESITTDPITYDSKYGAYEVSIGEIDNTTDGVGIDGDTSGPDGTQRKLYPVTTIVSITQNQWVAVYSGGISFSSLADGKYYLEPDSAGSSYAVRRNKSGEDKVAAGAVAFVTSTKSTWTLNSGQWHFGPSFGIGTSTGSKIQYYPGFSVIIGSFVITGGANIGTKEVLPSGLQEGGTTTNANALGTMGTRTSVGGFLSVTFTFNGDAAKTAFSGALAPAQSSK